MPTAGGVPIQVIYDPDGDNLDITNKIIFSSVRLAFAVANLPGTFQATVKDVSRTLDFTTGKRIIWKLDGNQFFGGYITQISRTFAFPVVDTTTLSHVKAREFVLRGVDYNILFDKRVFRNPDNYLKRIPDKARGYDGYFIKYAGEHYLDLPSFLDYSTEVDDITLLPRKTTSTFRWVQQGKPWREQMDMFAKVGGGIYYIRPYGSTGARLTYKALENNVAPYALSDKPSGSDQGFRDLDYLVDASGMVNDALVWGGDEFAASDTGAVTVFARSKNDTSITDHGRWQWGETHFGDSNYANQEEVDNRADAIVLGRTGDTIYEQNRGLQNPNRTYSLSWYQRNVPKVSGNFTFIYPGDLTTLKLYVFGDGTDPLIEILPCRSINISFPDNTHTGDSHVRFDATFSLQANDPWQLWQAIKRRRTAIVGT